MKISRIVISEHAIPLGQPFFAADARDYMLTEPIRMDAKGLLHLDERPGSIFEIDEEWVTVTRVG